MKVDRELVEVLLIEKIFGSINRVMACVKEESMEADKFVDEVKKKYLN